MTSHPSDRLRVDLTVFVTIAIWSLLAWRRFHGGVPAHHLLHNPDLPRISDWFGGVLLPVLAWWLLGLAGRRVQAVASPGLGSVIVGLVTGLAFGAAMAVTFFSGHQQVTSDLFFSRRMTWQPRPAEGAKR
ncbi:MAG: hypothetical protein V2J42_00235 [Wenzhouxiangella sp.]|jgi:hypothetical protein|nr:hypothetical protein [Wenzhouxiangella sp.]